MIEQKSIFLFVLYILVGFFLPEIDASDGAAAGAAAGAAGGALGEIGGRRGRRFR